MSKQEFYYYHHILAGEVQDMLPGPRIVCLPFNELSHPEHVADGPFTSLDELKRKSVGFITQKSNNPKRAEKICQEQFIIRVHDFVLVPSDIDPEFLKNTYRILQHSANGSITSKGVSGVHLFDSTKVNLLEVIRVDPKTGIFEARIEVKRTTTNKYIAKSEATTFFPMNWSMQTLLIECYVAYVNKVQISEEQFRGKTPSGIIVEFVLDKNHGLKTMYPILEKEIQANTKFTEDVLQNINE